MRFWVYSIDWRSLAVNILAECASEQAGEAWITQYIESRTDEQRLDIAEYSTLGITPASPQMQFAVEQFSRLNGRSMAAAS